MNLKQIAQSLNIALKGVMATVYKSYDIVGFVIQNYCLTKRAGGQIKGFVQKGAL